MGKEPPNLILGQVNGLAAQTGNIWPRVVQAGYVASRNLDGRLDVDAIGKSMLLQRRAPLSYLRCWLINPITYNWIQI